MDTFDKSFWTMVATLIGIITLQGGILLAAFKSIFTTKAEHEESIKQIMSRLYDDDSMPLFIPRKECKTSNKERERRIDTSQRAICSKIEKIEDSMEVIKSSQNNTNIEIGNLVGRFDQYLMHTSEALYGKLLSKPSIPPK